MSCCDYQCNQGRNCPVRKPAQVATAKPLYRRCDIGGACPRPDAKCETECLLSNEPVEQIGWLEEAVMYTVMTLAVSLLLVIAGGAAGYVWGML
ncbi:MAG: hypothetical protein RL032_1107 [Pseudomonadota bacterium]|jgi:hypothetical protein